MNDFIVKDANVVYGIYVVRFCILLYIYNRNREVLHTIDFLAIIVVQASIHLDDISYEVLKI